MFKKLTETALRQGMKLLADPRVMKLMSDNPQAVQAYRSKSGQRALTHYRWEDVGPTP